MNRNVNFNKKNVVNIVLCFYYIVVYCFICYDDVIYKSLMLLFKGLFKYIYFVFCGKKCIINCI